MPYQRPAQQGIVDKLKIGIISVLTAALHDDVADADISQARSLKSGLEQQAPTMVTVLVSENDPDMPRTWPHQPHLATRGYRQYAESGIGSFGREVVGSGMGGEIDGMISYERALTVIYKVFLREAKIDIADLDEDDVRTVLSIVSSRGYHALRQAGPRLGTGVNVSDDFGEVAVAGPFPGEEWADLEEGKSLRGIYYQRLWYYTVRV